MIFTSVKTHSLSLTFHYGLQIRVAAVELCVFRCVAFSCALFYFCNNGRCSNIFKHYNKEDLVVPDYEKMYKTLLDGVEKAIEMLKKTELACEEIYINTADEQ